MSLDAAALSIDEQIAYLTRGCVDVVKPDELRRKLERSRAAGVPLVVKVGFDPTAPDLHLGHTVLIRKMKHFQDLGHRVVFVIGDFTGMIGDPTGRSKTRPPLTRAEIEANAETYKAQVFKILDPARTVIDFNRRWLEPLGSDGWVRLAAKYNVAKMLERRDFRQRYESGQPIALHEFLYPLAQAYDSVALQADVELGGTDQLFNLNVGRDIMPAFGLEPQIVMTVPLLVGLDGVEKMSKSLGNYVGVNEYPETIVEKVVEQFRGSDDVLWLYFTLLTDLSEREVDELRRDLAEGRVSATDLRYQLARLITGDFHGRTAAESAVQSVRARHDARRSGALTDEAAVPSVETRLEADGRVALARVIVELKFAPSTSEAARQIKAGGVRINGEKVTEMRWAPPEPQPFYALQVGAKKLARLVVHFG
ncbi:MAG: tyrosine--tRNA ligase [Vicinamibacterales bacterium]